MIPNSNIAKNTPRNKRPRIRPIGKIFTYSKNNELKNKVFKLNLELSPPGYTELRVKELPTKNVTLARS